jgi:RNA-directed DNA polymerase
MKQIPELQAGGGFVKKLSAETEKFYRKKCCPKKKFGQPQVNKDGSEKVREIFDPVWPLKYTQKQINGYIQKITLPSSMFGGVAGKNNIRNASLHRENKYFLTIDLKNYFGNITNKQINQTLRNYGLSWDAARIITKLTTLNGHLPQGAPTSTPLANLVFSVTALKLEAFCVNRDITFTNFVDDLTFSAKKDFRDLTSQLLDILRQDGFFVNYNKIHYRRNSCEITGLIVKNGQMYLQKEMLQRCDRAGIKAYAEAVEKINFTYEKSK